MTPPRPAGPAEITSLQPPPAPNAAAPGPASALAVALAPGTRVGRYEVVRELGRGGMGVVYLARDTALRRDVALKVMLNGHDEHDRRRFLREAQAAGDLSHPFICKVYEVGEDGGVAFFTLELVEGLPLQRWIRERAPGRRGVLALFSKVCDAVAYAHLHGVIHRDLKPPNVLVDERGEPRVLDFGIAKRLDAAPEDAEGAKLTVQGAVIGTPSYMSPEQASGSASAIDIRSDVYTLGVILYELLAGQLPFRSESITQLLLQIASAEPPAPRAIDPSLDWELEAIVLKALEKKKEARYQTASELRADVERYLAGLPITARRAGVTYRARKLVARHRGFFSGLAIALVALAAAGLYAAREWRDARVSAAQHAQRLLREADGLDHKARGLLAKRGGNAAQAATAAAEARDKVRKAWELDEDGVGVARAARADELVALAGELLKEEAEATARERSRADLAAAAKTLVADGRRALEAARGRAVTSVADADAAQATLKEAETAFVQALAKDASVRGAEVGLAAVADEAERLARRRRGIEEAARGASIVRAALLRGAGSLERAREDAAAEREEAADAAFRAAIAAAEEALAHAPETPEARALRVEAGAGLVNLALAHQRFYLAALAIDGFAEYDGGAAERLRARVRDRRVACDKAKVELTVAEHAWVDGRDDVAAASFQRALALDPSSVAARYGAACALGRLLRGRGDIAGAIARFEEAVAVAAGPRDRADARRELEATRALGATVPGG